MRTRSSMWRVLTAGTSVAAGMILLGSSPAIAAPDSIRSQTGQSAGDQGGQGSDDSHDQDQDRCTVSLSASPQAPQTVGVTVELTVTATECRGAQYQFWFQSAAGRWALLQGPSPDPTATWPTEGLTPGVYRFVVLARGGEEFDVSPILSYTLVAPVVCTGVTWNPPVPASPQAPGASVTLSATALGCAHPEYEFAVEPPGGAWTVLQAYSPGSTATWNTAGLADGTYAFDVRVREAGSTAAWETHLSPSPTFVLQTPVVTCASVAWNAPNPPSPQAPSTQVNLGAAASGCTNPQYEFWVQPAGGAWTLLQGYSSSAATTWDTTGLSDGTYDFDVWVRQAGSTADWEAHLASSPTYLLQTPTACTSMAWNAPNPASPQAPSTRVTLSGTAAGCPNPQYEFWVQAPGGQWSILQPYGASATAVWDTTGAATGTYAFDIHVRDAGSTAAWEAHLSPIPTYTLQAGAACTSVTLTLDQPSPQSAGVLVQLTAASSGCPDPIYEFWVQAPGGQWTVLQPYGTSASAAWDTTGLAAGTYIFDVWVKEAGNAPDWEAHVSTYPSFTVS